MREMDRGELKYHVYAILQGHSGPEACITKEALWSRASGEAIIPWRRVNQTRLLRSLIAELQSEGVAVVHKSGTGGGYYLATDDIQIAQEAQWHHLRAMSHLKREKALRRMTAKELLQQLEIDLTAEEEAHVQTHSYQN